MKKKKRNKEEEKLVEKQENCVDIWLRDVSIHI